jgi:hypothetical protein
MDPVCPHATSIFRLAIGDYFLALSSPMAIREKPGNVPAVLAGDTEIESVTSTMSM